LSPVLPWPFEEADDLGDGLVGVEAARDGVLEDAFGGVPADLVLVPGGSLKERQEALLTLRDDIDQEVRELVEFAVGYPTPVGTDDPADERPELFGRH
jgi:hypothetical protein